MGAFGWLAGPEFEKAGGVPNAGLHDQIVRPMEVVLMYRRQCIGLRNTHLCLVEMRTSTSPAPVGLISSITVMGESAGASSIMHHLTAKGGNISLPFQKAVIQSPAFFPQCVPCLNLVDSVDMILILSICSIGGSPRAPGVLVQGPLSACRDGQPKLCNVRINGKRNGQVGENSTLVLQLMELMFVICLDGSS